MTKIERNDFNTTDLVLNIMERVARVLHLDAAVDGVADGLYEICCGLEDHDPDHGFGSSDAYGYVQHARKYFHIVAEK